MNCQTCSHPKRVDHGAPIRDYCPGCPVCREFYRRPPHGKRWVS